MDDWHLVLGVREGWGQETPIVFSPRDRRHHLYAIGKSGTGKTTLLRNMILQDIAAGNGVGGLRHAQTLLMLISPHRAMRWLKLATNKQPTDLSREQLKKSFIA